MGGRATGSVLWSPGNRGRAVADLCGTPVAWLQGDYRSLQSQYRWSALSWHQCAEPFLLASVYPSWGWGCEALLLLTNETNNTLPPTLPSLSKLHHLSIDFTLKAPCHLVS